MPKITVFIPVHNRETYIVDAINSVLAQTLEDFELLVIDDGSCDRTADVVAAYKDQRVRLVKNETNLGIPHTRNRALDLARAPYFANLDSDDLMRPDRLARQTAYLDAHLDCALVGTNKHRIDGQSRIKRKISRRPTAPKAVDARLLFRCCITNTSVMARTAILRDFKYDPDFPVCQDYDLFARMSRHHRLANLSEALVLYRRHGKQVSTRLDRTLAMQERIMERDLHALGVEFDGDDLIRHTLMARPRTQNRPDRAYLAWGRTWLARLDRANAASGRYAPDAFRDVLNRVWRAQCLKARPGALPSALAESLKR